MVNAVPPDPLEQRSRELFEDSVERLDARTRSRLNQARHQALAELKKTSTRRYWLAAPLGGLAMVALIALLMVRGPETPVTNPEGAGFLLDDFDIVADADGFEIVQDVEFYSWLADSGADGTNNSG